MKPTIIRNKTMFMASLHFVSKQLGAPLSNELQEKYNRKSARVIEGDTVKVLRGEFKGIEGKVTHVSAEKRGIAIEGIKREKLKGGNVDIYIHPSNVTITALNLEDKWRQNKLEGQETKSQKPSQLPEQKESIKIETQKEEKESSEGTTKKEPKKEAKRKSQKPKQKDTETNSKTNKKGKSAKSKKEDK